MEVARQYHRDDNGRMLLSRAYLATRGWFSAGAIQQAKAELLASELIFETVKGHRPNRASWYACTWRSIDKIDGYDSGALEGFERGAYRKTLLKEKRPPPAAPANAKRKKNAVLIPVAGTGSAPIVPVYGTESTATVPVAGAIRPVFDPLSVPVHGNPLDMPSTGARIGSDAVDIDPASKGGKVPARRTKPITCQHPDCSTLTLWHDFCRKHRHLASANTAAACA